MKKIVLCGGGTAGHIMPHLALLASLRQNFGEIVYIGSNNSMEQDLSEKNNLRFYGIECVKLKRSLSLSNIGIPVKLLRSISAAKKILKEVRPNIVFSKGGYVSLPVVIAAYRLRIPVVSHESDLTPGLGNRIAKRYCKCVCTSFSECADRFGTKGVFTGTPIRPQLAKGDKDRFISENNLIPDKKTVLFMGGSSGATALNSAVRKLLPRLLFDYNVIHITGKGNKSGYSVKGYAEIDFTEHIADIFAASDIVVCRAGSNSIFEMLSLKKPMLLIPLPKAASRGDQIDNAKYMKQRNLADMLLQEDLTADTLLKAIENLNKNAPIYKENISRSGFDDGAKKVLKEILKYSL